MTGFEGATCLPERRRSEIGVARLLSFHIRKRQNFKRQFSGWPPPDHVVTDDSSDQLATERRYPADASDSGRGFVLPPNLESVALAGFVTQFNRRAEANDFAPLRPNFYRHCLPQNLRNLPDPFLHALGVCLVRQVHCGLRPRSVPLQSFQFAAQDCDTLRRHITGLHARRT